MSPRPLRDAECRWKKINQTISVTTCTDYKELQLQALAWQGREEEHPSIVSYLSAVNVSIFPAEYHKHKNPSPSRLSAGKSLTI